MQPLSAPERPVSHYRNGKLRHAPEQKFELRLSVGDADRAERAMRRAARPGPMALLKGIFRTPVAALPAKIEPILLPRNDQRATEGEKRDPAPSRFAYRMERLWLTPGFRIFMRYGLPVVLVTAVAGLYLGDEGRRQAIAEKFASLKAQVENRPEFMVSLMSIDGASQPVADAVRTMVTVPLPASSFALDLEDMRKKIEQVDAVATARLRIKSGGVLAVEITERKPAILLRSGASLEMLDATGHRVATLLDRSARADLPVVAGEGARENVPEALAILAAAQPILPHVRGIVRMGNRRWDLVLDRDQVIKLPAENPVQAVESVMAVDGAEELLARDVLTVDLRIPDRPTVRMTQMAVEASRKLTETVTKVANE